MVRIAKDGFGRIASACSAGLILLLFTVISALALESGGLGVEVDAFNLPEPELQLSAADKSVPAGSTTTLSWSSSHAATCQAANGWTGARGVQGSEVVGPIDADTSFRLTCIGPGGEVTQTLTLRVTLPDELTVRLTATPETIRKSAAATLTWSAVGMTQCQATGGWSGNRPPNGRFVTLPLAETTSFGLSCSNGIDSVLAMVTVDVVDATLRWQPPTHNQDGTPIDDLAGYVVYWGQKSRKYIGSQRIESAARTKWVPDMAEGTYFFALTAVDAHGNESGYSNEVRKAIP